MSLTAQEALQCVIEHRENDHGQDEMIEPIPGRLP